MVVIISYFPSFVTNIFTVPYGTANFDVYLVYPWIVAVLYGKSAVTPLLAFCRKKIFRDTAKMICDGLPYRLKRNR